MQTTEELYESLIKGYLDSAHRKKVDIIQKAYNFALHAHESSKNPVSENHMIHPLSVAIIASQEMGLGSTSICAALLHDSLDDTD